MKFHHISSWTRVSSPLITCFTTATLFFRWNNCRCKCTEACNEIQWQHLIVLKRKLQPAISWIAFVEFGGSRCQRVCASCVLEYDAAGEKPEGQTIPMTAFEVLHHVSENNPSFISAVHLHFVDVMSLSEQRLLNGHNELEKQTQVKWCNFQ